MTLAMTVWTSKEGLAVGKGATVQEFVAMVGADKLEIDVAPWGEGHSRVRGWKFPPLGELRAEWARRYGGWQWDNPELQDWL
jgi:hypothetical protein